jgi:hypothetical protein
MRGAGERRVVPVVLHHGIASTLARTPSSCTL